MSHAVANNWIESQWAHVVLLCALGMLAFFYNLPVSLFGTTEGLYAAVTETMIRTGEYINLTLHGQPYLNKPPMFFWLQAFSSSVLGWDEVALRLPSALFAFGTVLVTYGIGQTLFSRTAGFWASLVVVTSYGSVWFGQMAIIDPILTFFMTLGMLGLARGYFREDSEWWYVIGFMALAFGAMVKNFHAFAMPLLLFLVVLWVLRDRKPLKASAFWVGLGLFGILLGSYYIFLGPEFWQHFLFQENLKRMTKLAGDNQGSALDAYFGSRPIHWYAYVMWFDFFPWSALIPSCLWLVWKRRPFCDHPRETFLLFWVMGYFLAFSLHPEKHERYLMPLVPGVALLVGYFYHWIWSSEKLEGRAATVFKIMLSLLSVAFVVLVFLGPYLLQKKWNLPPDVFPLLYQVFMVIGAGALLVFLTRSQIRSALNMVGLLAVGLMIGIVVFIVPGIDAIASPKLLLAEVRPFLKNPTDPIQTFQHWNWRNDEDLYYWQHVHTGAQIVGNGLGDEEALLALKKRVKKDGSVVILMMEKQYQQSVSKDHEITVTVLREFLRPKKKILLVSVVLKN